MQMTRQEQPISSETEQFSFQSGLYELLLSFSKLSINQSVINPLINSVSRTLSQSVSQSITQSTDQSFSQSVI